MYNFNALTANLLFMQAIRKHYYFETHMKIIFETYIPELFITENVSRIIKVVCQYKPVFRHLRIAHAH